MHPNFVVLHQISRHIVSINPTYFTTENGVWEFLCFVCVLFEDWTMTTRVCLLPKKTSRHSCGGKTKKQKLMEIYSLLF